MKYSLIDGFLNDGYVNGQNGGKGVCQRCGHYLPVFSGEYGIRVCKRCLNRLKQADE